jgi:hypothetical protein
MGAEGEGQQGRGQVAIEVEVDPAQRGQQGLGALVEIGD